MQSKHTTILVILTAIALIGMVTTSVQQANAPRSCAGCTAFKKLTHEFEKNVIDAATTGDSSTIPGLLEQYNQDVRTLNFTR